MILRQLGFPYVFRFQILRTFLKMLGSCKCLLWRRIADHTQPGPEPFSLPDPIPPWPEGTGFATSSINLGELEVCQVTKFESIWGCNISSDGKNGVSFYKPLNIPDGYFALGHYCQSIGKPLQGFVLVARESSKKPNHKPALSSPVDYTLVWSSHDGSDDETFDLCAYFWLPQPPEGYRPMGFLATNNPEKPSIDEVKCVRDDLTEKCEAHQAILTARSDSFKVLITVWTTRPLHRGIYERGVAVGSFYCSSSLKRPVEELGIACLKNLDPNLRAMPNLDQIHALIRHYGPRLFFHPNESYFPSSVSWFFENGALLYSKNSSVGEPIDSQGSNLPIGGTNDRQYWIDLPSNGQRDYVKRGNIESSKLYAHVKPAMGGIFTDIVMWVFCPFNGPGTLKLGLINIPLGKVGQHIGDWEHFTLRISNFSGELKSVYFSQHSGGEWVDAFDLEFFEGNKSVVYSSKNGHASFSRPGIYLQGSQKLGIGIRNDSLKSEFYVDSSVEYEVVSAEYLGDGVVREPPWLNFMREWGPVVVYDSRAELDRVIGYLPSALRCTVENAFRKLPIELYGEEGPTGPKEKNNWVGDERG